ncbi:hypothetical protein ACSAZK_01995 [Methanosarcina sp. Mfa9]|uniref:hypothetical protein n=1 Tax=Methanosarcina sp. Mfa9 TaxID=3439063 RepID=UPI003F86DCCC
MDIPEGPIPDPILPILPLIMFPGPARVISFAALSSAAKAPDGIILKTINTTANRAIDFTAFVFIIDLRQLSCDAIPVGSGLTNFSPVDDFLPVDNLHIVRLKYKVTFRNNAKKMNIFTK